MKWLLGFGFILLLGNWHLLVDHEAKLSVIGLPSWLYVFCTVYLLFLALLFYYSKAIKEEDL